MISVSLIIIISLTSITCNEEERKDYIITFHYWILVIVGPPSYHWNKLDIFFLTCGPTRIERTVSRSSPESLNLDNEEWAKRSQNM